METNKSINHADCPGCTRNQSTLVHGWISQPDTRGTMDILWACSSTIFVCIWVMLHLNLPALDDSQFVITMRKTKWFVLAMLAPELLMLFAGGQWAAAHRSVSDMHSIDIAGWTMVHALHAESGGFVFQARDGFTFPVTARQIFYLVGKGYVKPPTITRQEIWDKSKADRFAKMVAVFQGGWFTLQIIARVAQRLDITLLELSTVCLMTCTAATLFFWFHKPLDVKTPTVLTSEMEVSRILIEAGHVAEKVWKDTPLDFVEPLEYTSTQFPFHRLWGEQRRPLPRIPNDRDSLLHSWKVVVAIAIPTAAFGTLQLLAWNFEFPTHNEKMLWRYHCLANGVVLGVGCILEAGAVIASGYKVPGLHTFNDYKMKWPWCLLFFVAGALYVAARFIVIIEVLISLRALPASCFVNVEWTNFLPHV